MFLILYLFINLLVANYINDSSNSVSKLERRTLDIPVTSNMLKPSLELAKRGAWYASVAKCGDDQLKAWNCKNCLRSLNTTFISSFSNFFKGTRGYIAIDNVSKSINVVFRGTNNPINALNNLAFLQTRFSAIPNPDARVHSGFLSSMESLQSSFLSIIKQLLSTNQYKQHSINVIGHSLGGAMASLALIKIKSELYLGWERFNLLTYGQPRTGNQDFARWYDLQPVSSARVVNYNDIIPHSPPNGVLSYAHHGNELFIPQKGTSEPRYCNPYLMEDPTCSAGLYDDLLSMDAHYSYFDTTTGDEAAC